MFIREKMLEILFKCRRYVKSCLKKDYKCFNINALNNFSFEKNEIKRFKMCDFRRKYGNLNPLSFCDYLHLILNNNF